jgi:peptidyl-prolyl cis-trans isomerase SurA
MIGQVVFVAVMLLVAFAGGSRAERELVDRIVAVVEDEAIFESDVEMLITQFMFQQGRTSMTDEEHEEMYNRILQDVINDKLVVAQAGRLDVDIPFSTVEERVNQAIEDNKRSLGGEEAFERQLNREGFKLEDLKKLYRDQIRNRMLVEEVLRMEVNRGTIEIGDAELRQFYEEKKSEFPMRPAVVHLLTIFIGFESSEQVRVDAKARIDEVHRRAMGGESFTELAKTYSEDPSAPLGGDLGFVKPEDLAEPAFAKAVANLSIGEISNPIQTSFGFHIVQVTERNPDTGEVRIRHILIRPTASEEDVEDVFAKATSIRAEIGNGASFEEMADLHSTDPNATKGGDLGWLKVDDLPAFFQDVLAGMRPGEISQVLRESAGFRIVKLLEREEPRPYEFDEIKPELQRLYEQEKLEDLYKEYVKGLRDRFTVVVYSAPSSPN